MPGSYKNSIAVLLDTYQISGSARVVLQTLKDPPKDFSILLILFAKKDSPDRELLGEITQNKIPFIIVKEGPWFLSTLLMLKKIIKDRKINIIESNHYKTHLFALCLSKVMKIPWVAVSHGWTKENIKIGLFNLLDYFTLPFANANVAMGASVYSRLKSILCSPQRPRLIPTAYEFSDHIAANPEILSDTNSADSSFKILCVGRLSFEKGQDILLEAVKKLALLHPKVELLLAGDGPLQKNLIAQIDKLRIKNNVSLFGQVSSDSLNLLYQNCSCLVIPSRSEGFPNVLLEAAQHELPIIAASVGEIPTALGAEFSNQLFRPGESEDLFNKLKDLFSSDQLLAKQSAKQLKKRLSMQYSAVARRKKIYRLYRALLKNKSSLVYSWKKIS